MGRFHVQAKFLEDLVIFYTHGYINNLGGEKIEEQCEAVLKDGYRKVIINFEDSMIINSIGISILIGLIDRVRKAKGTVCFTNLSSSNSEVMEWMGLTRFAPVFQNEKDAIRYAAQGA